jgi:hypothetical protein
MLVYFIDGHGNRKSVEVLKKDEDQTQHKEKKIANIPESQWPIYYV